MTDKMIDLKEMAQMMFEYRQIDPIGCAEMCGRLIQADKDKERFKELEQTVAILRAELAKKAG